MGVYALDYSNWILPGERIVSSHVTQPGTPRLTIQKQEHEHLNKRILVTANAPSQTATLRCTVTTDTGRTHTFDLSIPGGRTEWWQMITG